MAMTWSSRLEYLLSPVHRGACFRAVKSLRAGCLKFVFKVVNLPCQLCNIEGSHGLKSLQAAC